MDNAKETIMNIYHDLLGKDIDSKLLRYWEKQLSTGQQSFDDFLKEIYHSLDYKSNVTTRFKKIYYEQVDVNLSIQTLRDFHKNFEGQCVSDKDIFIFITHQKSYIDKYSKIIKNVYLKTRNEPLNTDPVALTIQHTMDLEEEDYFENQKNNENNHDETFKNNDESEKYVSHMLSFYLDRFRNIPDYAMESLFDDMISNLHEHTQQNEAENKDDDENKTQQENKAQEIGEVKKVKEVKENDETGNEAENTENTDELMDMFIQQNYRERYNMDLPKKDVGHIRECIRDPVKIFTKIQQIEKLENIVTQLQDDLREFTQGKSLTTEYEKRKDREKRHKRDKEKEKEKEKETFLAGVNAETLDAFERSFKRPMFVHEYFKYVLQKAYEPDPTPITQFQGIYEKFVEDFNIMRRILNDYINVTLDEYTFVKKYLYEVDDARFFTQIVDEIVNSDDYKRFMCEKLDELYRSLFKESLQDHDITYVFKKVYFEKLDLYNEALNDRLIELKTETDDIISHIFTQYTKVLERPPDVYEINELVQKYRALLPTMSYDDINKDTEQTLIMSLEFHDILKKKIKQVVPHIKPRVLFDHLKALIADLDGETMETLEHKIKKIAESNEESYL